MTVTWLGHACFKLESKNYTVILDPYGDGAVPGCGPVRETADQVLCSHGHGDHAGVAGVTLRQGGPSPFTVETIATFHDDRQGALRGGNTIHILSDGECTVAHLGDLGCDLTPAQKEQLRGLTALLIPVGGYFTIDAAQAHALAEELSPAVVIPMHYRGESFGFDVLGTLDAFTGLRDDVTVYPGSCLKLTADMPRQTAVLHPRNAG